MIQRAAFVVAVALFGIVGCRSDDRAAPGTEPLPAVEPAKPAVAETPPAGIGGGPSEGWSRGDVVDRLARARCQARVRCGAAGRSPNFSLCVEATSTELTDVFGASTCEAFGNALVEACARELENAACGTETELSENCSPSKLCAQ